MNLTDNEIIKALECCVKFHRECLKCPSYIGKGKVGCEDRVKKGVLDLINRLEAENSKLQSEIESLRKENDELKNDFFQKHYKESECQELLSVKEAWRKERMHNIELQAEIEILKKQASNSHDVMMNIVKANGG